MTGAAEWAATTKGMFDSLLEEWPPAYRRFCGVPCTSPKHFHATSYSVTLMPYSAFVATYGPDNLDKYQQYVAHQRLKLAPERVLGRWES